MAWKERSDRRWDELRPVESGGAVKTCTQNFRLARGFNNNFAPAPLGRPPHSVRSRASAMLDNAHSLGALAGFVVLAHACYAVITHREALKIAEEEFESAPLAVVVECAIGAAMCAWGVLGFAGELLPIKSQPRELPPANAERMTDFIVFSHRGGAVPVNPASDERR